MADDSLLGKLKGLNPIDKAASIGLEASTKGTAPPKVASAPVATKRSPSGDIELPAENKSLVNWAHPVTGKRMTGTAAERDASLAKKTAIQSPRSMSKR